MKTSAEQPTSSNIGQQIKDFFKLNQEMCSQIVLTARKIASSAKKCLNSLLTWLLAGCDRVGLACCFMYCFFVNVPVSVLMVGLACLLIYTSAFYLQHANNSSN